MGLGGTAKKLQQIANMGEELYARMNDLREQLQHLSETVEDTNAAVRQLQQENEELRAVVGALAERQGIDPADVIESTHQRASGAADRHDQQSTRGSAPGSDSIDQPPDR